MFTGIVETMGVIKETVETEDGRHLVIDTGTLGELAVGDSISVSGACLTAVLTSPGVVEVDVVAETLARTSLEAAGAGSKVNLERAMPADGRFDGHIVQGHVDGVGQVLEMSKDESGARMRISVPFDLQRYIVEKGSITVDGVSLTITDVAGETLEVALIPHTLAITTLGLRREGDPVNLEVDVLAKYVERLLSLRQ